MKSHVNTGRSALLEENWLFLLAGSTQAGWVGDYYSDRENGSDKSGTTIAKLQPTENIKEFHLFNA